MIVLRKQGLEESQERKTRLNCCVCFFLKKQEMCKYIPNICAKSIIMSIAVLVCTI